MDYENRLKGWIMKIDLKAYTDRSIVFLATWSGSTHEKSLTESANLFRLILSKNI